MQPIRSQDDFATYVKIFNSQDLDRYSAYYADDIIMHIPSLKLTVSGKKDVTDWFASQRKAVREYLEPDDVIVSDVGVAIRANIFWEPLQDMLEVSALGRVPIPFILVYSLGSPRGSMHCLSSSGILQ
jgi:hypothetical protein